MDRSFPDSSAEAETLLLDAIANSAEFDSGDLAGLCTARPDLAPALRTLYGRLRQGRDLVGVLNPTSLGHSALETAPDPAVDFEPRYRVVREIARGGMSIILEVWDARLRRNMAMKRLRPVESGAVHGSIERERRRARLFHEAQVLAQLAHPAIVPMYDVAKDQHGEPYFTMLLVRGENLTEIFRRTWENRDGWSLSRAVGVLQRVCESVAYAHEKGVIHRDLKPANVMVGAFGETYVMDWGLARAQSHATQDRLPVERVGEEPAGKGDPAPRPSSVHSLVRTDRADVRHASGSSPLLTQEGDVVGTPAYMSPEQAAGRLDEIGAPADIYSAGAMLYELLAQHAPYCGEDSGRTPHEVLHEVRSASPASIPRLARGAPDELIAICERAMAREPARRYSSMRALSDDLRAFLENRVVLAHRTGALVELRKWISRNRWAAAAIAILLIASASIAVVQTLLKREVDLAREATEARAEELRREDYFNKIALASTAYQQCETKRLRPLLDACPEDLRGWEWRHLRRQADTSDTVLRLGGVVICAQFTPDGRSIVTSAGDSSSNDSRLQLWDADAGCLEREIELCTAAEPLGVNWFSFSGDRSWMTTMRSDWEIFLWDARTWSPRPSLSMSVPIRDWPQARFAPAGNWLSVAGIGPIQVWDVERRELARVLDAGQHRVAACWSPDGARLYAGAWDGSLSVWDVASGDLVDLLHGHEDRVNVVQASPDGRWFASGGWEKRVIVWDARTLKAVHDTGVLGYEHLELSWTPDSSILAVADGPVVRLLAADSWQECGRLVGHALRASAPSFDPEGRRAVTAGADGTLRTWNMVRADRWTYQGTSGYEPGAPSFSADGRWLSVSWFKAGLVELWSVAERRRVRTLRFGRRIDPPALSRDGSLLAIRVWGQPLRILDPSNERVLGEIPEVTPISVPMNPDALAFDPSGTRLSVVGSDGSLSLWNAGTMQLVWRATAYDGPDVWPGRLSGGCWSRDGSQIATFAFDGRVQVWDAHTGVLVREARGGAPRYWRGAFAPDGSSLYLSSLEAPGALECWDVATLLPKWKIEGSGTKYMGGSADGTRVFELGETWSLDVHDSASGRLIVSLATDGYSRSGMVVSPVDDLVVTVSNQGVRFWDTRPWR